MAENRLLDRTYSALFVPLSAKILFQKSIISKT